ncbi:hypothetical protein FHG87_007959 [Trinorchestia longiramus]|nr:hypothetical protein FHG87_007959 [Trinorchestia longiramus]
MYVTFRILTDFYSLYCQIHPLFTYIHQLGRLHHQLGRLVSESACERKDPGSNPAADMVDAARNKAWDLEPNLSDPPVGHFAGNVLSKNICGESHGSTTNEYHDEASFHRPMRKQDRKSESSDKASPWYDQKHDINQGSKAQPTPLYNEAATLDDTDFVPSTFKVNISTRALIT